uniref:Uncharacterized protein n=1 Tax=Arundo donax TaxID=35708 RepID=A0A0A9G234_ARUDO
MLQIARLVRGCLSCTLEMLCYLSSATTKN